MSSRHLRRVVLLSVGASCVACSALLGLEPPSDDSSSSTSDGSIPSSDGTSSGDSASPICASIIGTPYFPLDIAHVDTFSTAVLTPASTLFAGGTFDGRFVYFAGRGNTSGRFDTHGDFGDAGAWQTFVNATFGPRDFLGAMFDGRYVYFVPAASAAPAIGRYDTTGSVTAASSWQTFDPTTLGPDGGVATGFIGGVFDGRYIYFAPHVNGAVAAGRVVRYDTQASVAEVDAGDAGDGGHSDAGAGPATSFGAPTSWATFDMATLKPAGLGYAGAVFDGQYVYFVPSVNNLIPALHGGENAIAVRMSVDASFTAATSWSAFDVSAVNGLAEDFYGGAFDGRYVYYASRNAVILKYDSTAPFNQSSSWQSYDAMRQIPNPPPTQVFGGAAFDGRFIYFVPAGAGFGTLLRYDTMSTFTADCAWSTLDLTQGSPDGSGPQGFTGAIFDGQYLYLVPVSGGLVARFTARSSNALPNLPQFHGSFL